MPLQKVDSPELSTLAGGLFTEASSLEQPIGTTLDEQNFWVMLDGSRKRRRGLQAETGGESKEINPAGGTLDAAATWRWPAPGGDQSLNVVIFQVGSWLYFLEEQEVMSAGDILFILDLGTIKSVGATDDEIAENRCSFAFSQGQAILVNRYTEVAVLTWIPGYTLGVDSPITVQTISLRERNFWEISDEFSDTDHPPASVIGDVTDSHLYNLLNQGWKRGDIGTYISGQSKAPARNETWWLAYKRVDTTTGVSLNDGTYTFDDTKLVAELFGDANAPYGRFLIDPFDNAEVLYTYDLAGTDPVANTDLTASYYGGGLGIVTITSAAHGMVTGDFIIVTGASLNQHWTWSDTGGDQQVDIDGTVELIGHDTNTMTFLYPGFVDPTGLTAFYYSYYSYGYWRNANPGSGSTAITNPDGWTTIERPTCVAFWQGRVWYGGINHEKLSHRILYSQIVRDQVQMSKCYQRNDPTSKDFSAVRDDDGGYFNIQELGKVRALVPAGGKMFVLTSEGVWVITPGEKGYFSPVSYGIQQISAMEVVSKSYTMAENFLIVVTAGGLMAIDVMKGSAESMTSSINNKWISITAIQLEGMQLAYDDAHKRIWCLYSAASTTLDYEYDSALVYDLRRKAWQPFYFGTGATGVIKSMHSLDVVDDENTERKMKFVYCDWSGTPDTLDIYDLESSDFLDPNGVSTPAWLQTGHNTVIAQGNYPEVRKQAPVLHMFMNRTETGVTAGGVPINESSVLVQPRFDFANNTNTGKVLSSPFEAYRHVRQWTPATLPQSSFNDGYPVVITRSKIRGRGRAVSLKFVAGDDKDAHIIGYKLQLQGSGRV